MMKSRIVKLPVRAPVFGVFVFIVFFICTREDLRLFSKDRLMPGDFDVGNLIVNKQNFKLEKKKLAVIVPFRDCFDELSLFAPHMRNFLSRQEIPYHIFVINQADKYRFNRASLLNVGHLYTKSKFDYMVLHDIDLLPLNEKLSYEFPSEGVFHMAADYLLPAHNKSRMGGILVASNKDYEMLDGMSNHFWGWGLEDDELLINIHERNVKVTRPKGITTGKNGTFIDIHSEKRTRDIVKCYGQDGQVPIRSSDSGLKFTKYLIQSVNDHATDDARFTIIDVELECDRKVTPWCECKLDP